jgi:2-polyprenyl-6-methoxyphenol hydroxylase-like FAD-dependent oxidoreductase
MVSELKVRCCVAGGGPAGMMAGFLLARAGVEVAVLERWPDFFRDFRGDTIHPSTLEVLAELGLLEAFLRLPHQEYRELSGIVGDREIHLADFRSLKVHCPFLALVPQWDFLNYIADQGKRYPGFRILMETSVVGLLEEGGRIRGVKAKGPQGDLEVRAELVIGADGRHSTVRAAAGLEVLDLGAPMDVLWFHLSRRPADQAEIFGHLERGRFMVTINRDTYWQCGFVIAKGELEKVKSAGLETLRQEIVQLSPWLADRVGELKTWDEVKLLSVRVDRLRTWWRPGLLCIGDAAHAMSPVGGVGINLAVQDAVAASNVLIPRFLGGGVRDQDLAAIEKRRTFPTKMTQRLQVAVQNTLIRKVLADEPLSVPFPMRLLERFPWLRRVPARFVGLGFRPEHIAPSQRAPASGVQR